MLYADPRVNFHAVGIDCYPCDRLSLIPTICFIPQIHVPHEALFLRIYELYFAYHKHTVTVLSSTFFQQDIPAQSFGVHVVFTRESNELIAPSFFF